MSEAAHSLAQLKDQHQCGRSPVNPWRSLFSTARCLTPQPAVFLQDPRHGGLGQMLEIKLVTHAEWCSQCSPGPVARGLRLARFCLLRTHTSAGRRSLLNEPLRTCLSSLTDPLMGLSGKVTKKRWPNLSQ